MSEDTEHWNEGDTQEEEEEPRSDHDEEDEDDEEEEEPQRGRYNNDDEEDEEDEEEDEDEGVKRKKKRRKKSRGVNRFLDVEAAVDSEDEEESGDDGEEGFLVTPEDEVVDTGRRSRLHQRLDAQRELSDRDMQNIAEEIESRYRNIGATRYTGDLSNIPQRLLMPSVNDANLWQVRVRPGRERDICFNLMRKAIDLEFTARPLKILSAFQRDNLPGMIYVEARSQAQVLQALQGLVNVFPSRGITLVPIEEMAPLLTFKKKETNLAHGTWVRIKRGKYAGDLAQVVDVSETGDEVGLRFIPRIDLNPKDDVAAADGKKRKKMGSGLSVNTRPPQRFFNVEEIIKVYDRKSVAHKPKSNCYVFQNDTFKFGYIEKDIRITGIQTDDVNPTLDEITKFMKHQEGDDTAAPVDLSMIADASKKAAVVVLQPGDHVEVFEGEQTGVHGIVQSINGDIVTLLAQGLDLDGHNVEVEVPARSVRKKFKPGDHVKVMSGKNIDETGLVVSVVDSVVTFLSDMSLQEVSVFSKDLREAAEVGASTNIVGNYELHDLVQLDIQTVGVIFKTERDSFRVLDQNGQVRVVQPHQIMKGRDSRRAIATDAHGHELRVGDNVKEVDGESRKGQVLHIHQSFFAFLYNREISENGGVFVTRARSLTSLAPKNMIKSGTTPDLSKMNPAVGSAAPVGGFVGSGAMGRGPRDRLIGIHVLVCKGTYKGYIGIIKDTNGSQARVELNTGNKVITIEKEKLKRPGGPGEKPRPLESFPSHGTMGPPNSVPGRTPNPYSDFGSKTPAWASSTRTPNPYGGGRTPNPYAGSKTPAWSTSARTPNPYDAGGKTPAWNASARTPNPFAGDGGRTPAWNSSSRTPNPYGNSGYGETSIPSRHGGSQTPARSAWGGATPGRPGGWSNGDSGDDSWNQPEEFSAPTPGANPYSAPTPGAMGAPTPGPSAMGAPTPYGAPTPGPFGAPTPSFARTPGVAATPFVPGNPVEPEQMESFEPDQETWLLDPEIERSGLCVEFRPYRGSSFVYQDTPYEGAQGVLRGVNDTTGYTATAQVFVENSPRSDHAKEIAAVAIHFLAPVPPSRRNEMAVVLHGDLKGHRVKVVEYDGGGFIIQSAHETDGKLANAKKFELCKWVSS